VLDEEIMDLGPEWRAFEPGQREKRSRVGAPETVMLHDKGLSTDIDWRNRDIHGNDISGSTRAKMYRLRMWQRRMRISDAIDRNLAFALSELDRMGSQIGLPRNIREIAALLYRKAVINRLVRGRSIEGMVSACLYAACRIANAPRTLDEIEDFSKVDKKEIGRSYRYLVRELNLKLRPTNPVDYVVRFGDQLGVTEKTKRRAMRIVNQAIKMGLTSGKGLLA